MEWGAKMLMSNSVGGKKVKINILFARVSRSVSFYPLLSPPRQSLLASLRLFLVTKIRSNVGIAFESLAFFVRSYFISIFCS